MRRRGSARGRGAPHCRAAPGALRRRLHAGRCEAAHRGDASARHVARSRGRCGGSGGAQRGPGTPLPPARQLRGCAGARVCSARLLAPLLPKLVKSLRSERSLRFCRLLAPSFSPASGSSTSTRSCCTTAAARLRTGAAPGRRAVGCGAAGLTCAPGRFGPLRAQGARGEGEARLRRGGRGGGCDAPHFADQSRARGGAGCRRRRCGRGRADRGPGRSAAAQPAAPHRAARHVAVRAPRPPVATGGAACAVRAASQRCAHDRAADFRADAAARARRLLAKLGMLDQATLLQTRLTLRAWCGVA